MLLNKPIGKVNDNYVKSLFLKDSCDGSGLNTSENSKDSHPLGLGVFWSDIFGVILFNFHKDFECVSNKHMMSKMNEYLQ